MHVLSRSKSYRIRHKERNLEEEEENLKKKRHLEKLKAKGDLIRAEFEKHKKKILLSGSEMSKANEAKLRAQLNELTASNLKKMHALEKLSEINDRVESENQNTTAFTNTLAKFETKVPDTIHISMDYHSNRTALPIINNADDPEVLGNKLIELRETLENIERLSQLEEEAESAVKNKLEELVVDNNIMIQDVKELEKINRHFDHRFNHLKEIEFAAQSKYAETVYDLNELREITRDLKSREKAYKKEKRKYKESEEVALVQEQNKLSNIMVSLDDKKLENMQTLEELKKVSLKNEQMVEKQKSIQVIVGFAELIEHLSEFFFNSDGPKDALKNLIESRKEDRRTFSTEEDVEKQNKELTSMMFFKERSMSKTKETPINRGYYLEKLYQFYDKHPEGPDPLIAGLNELYSDLCFKETSLKKMYDEFQTEKLKKEYQINQMMKDLKHFKQGSTRDLRSLEMSDGGVFTVNSQEVTMNQAKFLIDTKKETDSETQCLGTYETFILRIYLDSIEMVARFGKLLTLIADQADYIIPANVKKLANDIQQNVSLFKKAKKLVRGTSDASKIIETAASLYSDRDVDPGSSPDLNMAFQAFVARFGGYADKATEFVNHLKQDTMIGSFIKTEDIMGYLENYGREGNIHEQVEAAIEGIPELRQKAVDNMIKRLNTAYVYYNELIGLLRGSKEELLKYFSERNHKVSEDLNSVVKQEQSEHVKTAMKKNWERMMERYEYDPLVNYRSGHSSFSQIASYRKDYVKKQQDEITDQEIKEEERLDAEDLKAKLNEITRQTLCKIGPRSYGDGTAYLSKTKQDEERKMLLMKHKKEKMKQVLYNMSEDEFFEWNRRQIGRGEESLIAYLDDQQGLKKPSTSSGQRSSTFTPIDGIKMMIENSKMLSKINILERHKSGPHGIKALKYDILGNYIPADPKVFPRSAASSPKRKSKHEHLQRLFSPNSQTQQRYSGNFGYPSSTRNSPVSEHLDSTNDLRFRPSIQATINQQSKFKHVSPSYSQSDLKHDLDGSSQNFKSQERTLGTSLPNAQKPVYNKSQSQKAIIRNSESGTESTHLRQKTKLGNLLKQNSERGNMLSPKERSQPKIKEENELPKLKKSESKKKYKQKRLSLPETPGSMNDLCNLFIGQGDPMVQGVYSSSLFATNMPGSPNAEELQFRRGYL